MYSFGAVTDIDADFLRDIGVTLLMLDLDNTLAPYGVDAPGERVMRWADAIRVGGTRLFIVSNSRRPGRTERFAEAMRVDYIKNAHKPSPSGIIAAIRKTGVAPERSALAGDQVYTDALAANRAGVTSILVRPIRLGNAFLAARYGLEAPFRAIAATRPAQTRGGQKIRR
jgi:HAD superfamily phosphatase (TIGR01668 family)